MRNLRLTGSMILIAIVVLAVMAFAQSLPLPSSLPGEVWQVWAKYYAAGLSPAFDEADAVAFDNNGNVYVTGYSTRAPFGTEYCTVKYDGAGNQLWETRYSGDPYGENMATAIQVDGSGNVCVTGKSWSGTSYDYATVKYNAAGAQQWAVRYNGPGNGLDEARAMALDAAGNVIVTGMSADADFDYATVKYSASGSLLWAARYKGSADRTDEAETLVVDQANNVFVTGTSYGSGTSDDFTTIKYLADGSEQWIARYDGSANGTDRAIALALDHLGNLYVAGETEGSGTSFDYAIVKYSAGGAQEWAVQHNGSGNGWDSPTALAVDGSGNVYVTGYAQGQNYDYTTIKYDASGVEQWKAVYNGPANRDDRAFAIAVDEMGHVIVAGQSQDSRMDFLTIQYDADGSQQWAQRHKRMTISEDFVKAMAVDPAGNVYLAGFSWNYNTATERDYCVLKYDVSGDQKWSAYYHGSNGSLYTVSDMAIDGAGNVYVTGDAATTTDKRTDYVTIKYNTSGVEQWVAFYNAPRNSDDEATAITVDGSGNVYVTGRSIGPSNSYGYATLKYNPQGVEQWVVRYDYNVEEANALAVDNSGNVYVTGISYDNSTGTDYLTIKYNSAGVQQWTARYNGPGNGRDEAKAMVLDGSGDVYVTGFSTGSNTKRDYTTVKYSSDGVEQWVARYDGQGNGNDEANAIASDGNNNVIVTGMSTGAGTSYDYATIKYSAAGTERWVARYNDPSNHNDKAYALAVDGNNHIYVTGSTYAYTTNFDYLTIRYDEAGVQQWAVNYNGSKSAIDIASDITIDGRSNVYVTGASTGFGTGYDYATIKYDAMGNQQYVARYNAEGSPSDEAVAVSVDDSDNVYVTGNNSGTNNGWKIFTTVKYSPTGTPVSSENPDRPAIHHLCQNYPNPFNPTTIIEYELPKSALVRLIIYDVLGRRVKTLVKSYKPAGIYQSAWDGSDERDLPVTDGVYFCRMESGDLSSVIKMTLVR